MALSQRRTLRRGSHRGCSLSFDPPTPPLYSLRERWRLYLDRVRIRVLISSTFTNVYEGGMTTSVNRHFLIDTGALTSQYPVPEASQTESRANDPRPTHPNHYVNEKGVVMPGHAA